MKRVKEMIGIVRAVLISRKIGLTPLNKKQLRKMNIRLATDNMRLRCQLLNSKTREIAIDTYMMDLPMDDEEQKISMLKTRLAHKLVKELSEQGLIKYQFTTTDFKMINGRAAIMVAKEDDVCAGS